MPLKKLTDRFVDTIKPGTQRTEYIDSHRLGAGLRLRVSENGKKSWSVMYRRKSDSKMRRKTIGRYPDFSLSEARKEAARICSEVARGKDPASPSAGTTQVKTFNELAEHWIEKRAIHNRSPKSIRNDRYVLNHDIYPFIGDCSLEQIQKRQIIEIADRVLERGAGFQANRVLGLCKTIFSWAEKEDLIVTDPARGIDKRARETPRDRVLDENEIRILWEGLEAAPVSPAVVNIIRLCLVTAQRVGEVSSIEKSELDLSSSNPTWTIPSRRVKNRRAHRVPLSKLALEIIRKSWDDSGDSSFLFPSKSTGSSIGPNAATRAMSRARQILSLENVRMHDLRRTVASHMAQLRVPESHISRVLNHASLTRGTITGAVYIQYSFDEEKRRALEVWEGQLRKILMGRVKNRTSASS